MMNRQRITSFIYFTLSAIITWWFIEASPLYDNMEQKLLSCGIAGAKWGIQLLAAFVLLNEKKWVLIKNISIVCLAGSIILLPFSVMAWFWQINSLDFFVGSLLTAVAVMILLYALAVKNAQVSIRWWLGWLFCLAIAVTLQLTAVFDNL